MKSLVLFFALLCSGSAVAQQKLTLTFTNLPSGKGEVLAEICTPKDQVVKQIVLPAQKGTVIHKLELPKGQYAVRVFHDANSNKKLDIGLFGPEEVYGFSNNARGWFGPPELSKQLFNLEQDLTLSIKLQ